MNIIQKLVENVMPPKPTQQQTSTWLSSYYSISQVLPYNPDDLVEEKGLEIYDEMSRDDQVRAAFMVKKLMITSREWNIEDVSEEHGNEEIVDFIKYCFEDGFSGVFKDFLHGILSALQYGFSLTEKNFKVFNQGKYKGKIGLGSLKTRPPHTFEFNLNRYGDIESILQHQDTGDAFLNLNKFILYSYDKQFSNPYGSSDFRSAFRSWVSKNAIIKFWNIYLERNGMPITVGKYKRGTSQKDKTDLQNVMKNIQAKTSIPIPDDVSIELLEAKNGSINYEVAITNHNTMISRAFLMPELIGFTDHKTGSQSLGKEQFDMFYKILEDIQENIADLINEHVIKDLVNYNFANVTEYPKFVFNPLDTRDKASLYDIWDKFLKTGAVKQSKTDEDFIRMDLGMPERTEESEPILKIGDEEEPLPPALPAPAVPPTTPPVEEPEEVAAIEAFAEKNFSRTMTKYEEKINLTEIVNDYDSLTLIFAKDLGVVISDIENTMLMKIKRKKIIEKKDFSAIKDVSITATDMSRLANAFLKNTKIDFKTGRSTAMTDVKKNIKLVEMDTTGALMPKEALDYLASKSINITGTEAVFIKKNVSDILFAGMKNGKTESTIMYELSQFFDNYTVMQATGTGVMLPIQDITGRINTVIRTNLSDAYNMGRTNAYNDTNVSDFIPALQYSAIIDQRTTDFCAKYDGRVYAKNDPIWDNITPPNHYSCRSLAIPIFEGDEYKLDKRLAIQQPVQFGGQPS